MTTANPTPTLADFLAKDYERSVKAAANRLRDAADDFERKALSMAAPGVLAHPYSSAASNAVSGLLWDVANLSVSRLLDAATAIDVNAAKESGKAASDG